MIIRKPDPGIDRYCLCAFILKYTKIGTYTYAIGSNEVVAKNMGVNVSKYKIVAFTLAGFSSDFGYHWHLS